MFQPKVKNLFNISIIAYLTINSTLVNAEEVATVTHLSGPLLATTENGAKKILAPHSGINSGDILITADKTYARIKFTDNGEVTLKPNTQFKIENFRYDEKTPEKSNAFFNLIKGGLRAITGLIGKNSVSREKYKITAASATIGIRGTMLGVSHCYSGSCGAGVADGLHVDVTKGAISLSNAMGSQEINAGQFAYIPNTSSPPVILPSDPGLKFNPPQKFFQAKQDNQNSVIGKGNSGGSSCEVR